MLFPNSIHQCHIVVLLEMYIICTSFNTNPTKKYFRHILTCNRHSNIKLSGCEDKLQIQTKQKIFPRLQLLSLSQECAMRKFPRVVRTDVSQRSTNAINKKCEALKLNEMNFLSLTVKMTRQAPGNINAPLRIM